MKNFIVVQEHFRKLRCAHCQESFTPEGVKLLREEKDYWVVRVHCTACAQPAGVAIVGVEYDAQQEAPAPRREAAPAPQRPRGVFTSKREEEKFAGMAAITDDELLDAAAFIRELGSDWMRYLPGRS